MAANNTLKVADKVQVSGTLQSRYQRLRAGFMRQLNLSGRPNTLQEVLVDAAARSTAIAEEAMFDPAVTYNDRVRLSGEARRARAELQALIAAKAESEPVPSLAELLEGTE